MTVSFLPGNNAVAQDSNTLDFTLHHIANLEVAGLGIGAQGAREGSSAHGDDVARAVSHGGIARKNFGDVHQAGARILPELAVDSQPWPSSADWESRLQ